MSIRQNEHYEKRKMKEISREKEAKELREYLREMDRRITDSIQRRFGDQVPVSKIEQVRKTPAEFVSSQQYQEHLDRLGIRHESNQRVLGDINGDKVTVDREQYLVPRTLTHERLHQLSHPLYRSMLGNNMYEGTTEYLSSKVYGDLHIADAGKCYPQQVRIMEMLHARVGDDTIGRAYFKGDWTGLKDEVDKQLGDGTFAEIVDRTQQGKFSEAERLIQGERPT